MGRICGKEFIWAMVIFLGPITFGTIMCYPSPTAAEIQKHFGLNGESLTWAFYNSVSSLFGIAGPFVTSGILKWQKASRKRTMFIIAIAGCAFWLLNCLTKINIWAGIVIRAFLGIVMGAYSAIDPMYLVEIAPEGSSGFYGSLNQVGIVLGIVFFDLIGPSLTYLELDFVGAAVCALQAITVPFISESPAVAADLEASTKKAQDTRPKETLWQKKYMCGLFSGVGMMFLQQFSGINAILTNLALIMNKAGLNIDGNYQAGISSIAQLVAVVIGGLIVDKLGRKIVWMISCGIIVVFLLIFALNDKYKWNVALPLVCIFLYQLGFGLGMGPIPWFIIPEYFNDDVRAMATTIVSASNWIFAFLVIFIWPAMEKSMGMFGGIIFFMVITCGAFVFGIFCVHEPHSVIDKNESSSDKPEAL